MKKSIYRLTSIAFMFIATCGSTCCTEPATEQPIRVEVGKNCCSNKKHRHKTHRTKHAQEEEHVQAKCLEGIWTNRAYQPTYYIKSIGADGDTIAMNDETMWAIASSSAHIANNWQANTPILITPSKWYSKYDYYLTNQLTHESVTAKLSQGPFLKYSILINAIDQSRGTVYLSNGTQWNVSRDESFNFWQRGQAVLIGENSRWSGKKHILININENNYLTADFIQ